MSCFDSAQSTWEEFYNDYVESGDVNAVVDNYDRIALGYDTGSSHLVYALPKSVTKLLKTKLPVDIYSSEETTLLDIAAGTGLIADELAESGFKGKIDAIDGSAEMLSIAKSKDVYRNLITQIITVNDKLPYADCSYDVAVCCAAFSQAHLQPEVILDMVRVIRPGGYAIFSVRNNSTAKAYVAKFKEIVRSLDNAGTWKKLTETLCEQYAYDFASDNAEKQPMKSILYCYKKL